MELKDMVLSVLADLQQEQSQNEAKKQAVEAALKQELAAEAVRRQEEAAKPAPLPKEPEPVAEAPDVTAMPEPETAVVETPPAPVRAAPKELLQPPGPHPVDREDEPAPVPSESEYRFLLNLKERLLVVFEGFQSPNNREIEAKVDLLLNFLEYLLAVTEERLEQLGHPSRQA